MKGKTIALAGISLLMAGCSGTPLESVSSAYSGVRAAMGAKSAYTSVKAIAVNDPIFSDYESVYVVADLSPDKSEDQISYAFADNMAYLVSETAAALNQHLTTCLEPSFCKGETLTLQFKESAYDENLVERVTMGNRLKGSLLFVDSTGGVVTSRSLEGVENYAQIMGLIKSVLSSAMLKSYPSTASKDSVKQLDQIPTVKKDYEKLLNRG